MANIKELKTRIKAVKSTKKITQAMKLVAASKVRRFQQRVLNSRPYTEKLNDIVKRAVSAIPQLDKKEIPLMHERDIKSACLIVISSDRGLCGSYNTNIIKKTAKRIQELKELKIEPKLIVIGNKANNFFKRVKVDIIESFTHIPQAPTIELTNLITTSAEKVFLEKAADKVEIIGTDFISMIRYSVYIKHFLPIISFEPIPELEGGVPEPRLQPEHRLLTTPFDVLFEPSLENVLNNLLPLYLSNVILHALFEASCSELASRMNAMSNATKNAEEIIDLLTIVYNKARQASITQELTEIVGGVEALK